MRSSMLLVAGIAFTGLAGSHVQAADGDKPITLLGILAEWQYPGSKWREGATMSDGGHAGIQSVKCHTVLLTPDSFEKVVQFYAEKFEKGKDPKSVTMQDDSVDRPVQVRVIVVNKLDTSTTLVISRAKGEKETHIVWTHFIRLGVKP